MITNLIAITVIIIIQIRPSGNKPIFVQESKSEADEYAILRIHCNAEKKARWLTIVCVHSPSTIRFSPTTTALCPPTLMAVGPPLPEKYTITDHWVQLKSRLPIGRPLTLA
ncbi:uncharacterized protein LOC143900779 isoform X4 [Temnothorax americanus]|uniref:uncharacterized protein LOC143900779 isoform X4 n=1 Tax=Temnothorax americanus TaxID=1964332 RepID=UPI004067657C